MACAIALAGCGSTPQHTNVLVFGTTTKVALDVSQDPTSGLGVTLGYKRQEAVWMPLLPNQADLKPLTCVSTTDSQKCDKYVGTNGNDQDTYSVLASFGANIDGNAASASPSAQAKGSIAQYFATGWAARELARSGAALVNSDVLPLTATQRLAVLSLEEISKAERNAVLSFVRDAADASKIDKAKMGALLAKAMGANAISSVGQARFGTVTTTTDLTTLMIIHDVDTARLAPLTK